MMRSPLSTASLITRGQPSTRSFRISDFGFRNSHPPPHRGETSECSGWVEPRAAEVPLLTLFDAPSYTPARSVGRTMSRVAPLGRGVGKDGPPPTAIEGRAPPGKRALKRLHCRHERLQTTQEAVPDRRAQHGLPGVLRHRRDDQLAGAAHQRAVRLYQHAAQAHPRREAGLSGHRVGPQGRHLPRPGLPRLQGHPPRHAGCAARPDAVLRPGRRGLRGALSVSRRLRGRRRHGHPRPPPRERA